MFVLIFVALVLLAHWYLWHRLVRRTTRPGRLRRVLTWSLVALLAVLVTTFVGTRMGLESWVAWPGYIWLALMFYLVIILVVLEVPRAVATAFLRRAERRDRTPEPEPEPVAVPVGAAPPVEAAPPAPPSSPESPALSRRLFLGRTTAAIAGVSALGTVGYGMSSALGDPVIERVSVTLPRLDPRLSGLRFAVVSDIHLGPLTGLGHTERIVRMINGLEADVVAIVGDLVDGSVAQLGALARPLRSLESRYGAYFVTGNHEYFTAEGPGEWIEELKELGVRSLRNERVEIAHQGAVLDLAGVNDVGGAASGDGPDFGKALGGRDTSRSTVLLAHQPIQVDQAAGHGVDLQLSGHTHGGQIAPFNLVVGLQQPVVSGLATVGGTQVYVTRGAGFWGPPVRVGAPPEITMLELRA
ncbi:putative MPP superfamily phosphohydrolase [Nonomuraea thailandensis]|uniref:MPP superfamily phosphohydrolase n=1 Tax=Nonomuraea thailandensis TaxID=1188745 RepID=A0A9X2K8F0_9ACTN|nr:metallophosphoesterase [Nonomuraea thailandensis]MCP2363474.1 putative MPP superfamily phosphohydrolase [Nonomuraea thailandensis]